MRGGNDVLVSSNSSQDHTPFVGWEGLLICREILGNPTPPLPTGHAALHINFQHSSPATSTACAVHADKHAEQQLVAGISCMLLKACSRVRSIYGEGACHSIPTPLSGHRHIWHPYSLLNDIMPVLFLEVKQLVASSETVVQSRPKKLLVFQGLGDASEM